MNWVKTYESYIYEGTTDNPEVNRFESIIDIPKGSGVISTVVLDQEKHVLTVGLIDKINMFDLENVMTGVKRNLKSIKTEYNRANKIVVGSAVIEL